MLNALRTLWAYLARDALMAVSYRLGFMLQLGTLFATVVSFYFLAKLVGGHPAVQVYGGYLPFAVIGIAMMSYLTTGFNSFASAIRNEQMMGTLESVMMTPARISMIVVASSAWSFAWATLSAIVTIVTACLVFGIELKGNIPAALLLLLLTTVTFSCVGVISASFIMVFKRGDPVNALVGMVSILLGGVVYPISELPPWLQSVSRLLPITHGLEGVRSLLLVGRPFSTVVPQFLILLAFAGVAIPLSLFLFSKAVVIAKREGSLLHY